MINFLGQEAKFIFRSDIFRILSEDLQALISDFEEDSDDAPH
jgi:hypothetical protein